MYVQGRRHEAGILAPGSLLSSSFPRPWPQWIVDVRSPVTVAGAAAVSHRVPIQIPCGNLARAADDTEYWVTSLPAKEPANDHRPYRTDRQSGGIVASDPNPGGWRIRSN